MPRTPKQYFYFRQHDARDQALFRLLKRQRPEVRTALFREFVLRGYRQYLKQQQAPDRAVKGARTNKSLSNGSPAELSQPVKASRPLEDFQPWK